MVANSDAIYKALVGGHRAVKREAQDIGKRVLSDFRNDVATPYPPPSSPGEPPHLRTGGYRNSLKVKKNGDGFTIHSTSMLSVWLEFGTTRDGKPHILPRPHWRTKLQLHVQRHMTSLGEAMLRGER